MLQDFSVLYRPVVCKTDVFIQVSYAEIIISLPMIFKQGNHFKYYLKLDRNLQKRKENVAVGDKHGADEDTGHNIN